MSCCGGNCGCGSGCKCGSGCGGEMYSTVLCTFEPSNRASDGSALHNTILRLFVDWDAKCTLTSRDHLQLRPLLLALLLRRHTSRDLRWERQRRTAASADPTANATLAPANETRSHLSNQQKQRSLGPFLINNNTC